MPQPTEDINYAVSLIIKYEDHIVVDHDILQQILPKKYREINSNTPIILTSNSNPDVASVTQDICQNLKQVTDPSGEWIPIKCKTNILMKLSGREKYQCVYLWSSEWLTNAKLRKCIVFIDAVRNKPQRNLSAVIGFHQINAELTETEIQTPNSAHTKGQNHGKTTDERQLCIQQLNNCPSTKQLQEKVERTRKGISRAITLSHGNGGFKVLKCPGVPKSVNRVTKEKRRKSENRISLKFSLVRALFKSKHNISSANIIEIANQDDFFVNVVPMSGGSACWGPKNATYESKGNEIHSNPVVESQKDHRAFKAVLHNPQPVETTDNSHVQILGTESVMYSVGASAYSDSTSPYVKRALHLLDSETSSKSCMPNNQLSIYKRQPVVGTHLDSPVNASNHFSTGSGISQLGRESQLVLFGRSISEPVVNKRYIDANSITINPHPLKTKTFETICKEIAVSAIQVFTDENWVIRRTSLKLSEPLSFFKEYEIVRLAAIRKVFLDFETLSDVDQNALISVVDMHTGASEELLNDLDEALKLYRDSMESAFKMHVCFSSDMFQYYHTRARNHWTPKQSNQTLSTLFERGTENYRVQFEEMNEQINGQEKHANESLIPIVSKFYLNLLKDLSAQNGNLTEKDHTRLSNDCVVAFLKTCKVESIQRPKVQSILDSLFQQVSDNYSTNIEAPKESKLKVQVSMEEYKINLRTIIYRSVEYYEARYRVRLQNLLLCKQPLCMKEVVSAHNSMKNEIIELMTTDISKYSNDRTSLILESVASLINRINCAWETFQSDYLSHESPNGFRILNFSLHGFNTIVRAELQDSVKTNCQTASVIHITKKFIQVAITTNGEVQIIYKLPIKMKRSQMALTLDDKILLGDEVESASKSTLSRQFKLNSLFEDTTLSKRYKMGDGETKTRFEFICGLLLYKLKHLIETETGQECSSTILLIPLSFTSVQRQALQDAGTIATFNTIILVNDTTAAALGVSYVFSEQMANKSMAIFSDNHPPVIYKFNSGRVLMVPPLTRKPTSTRASTTSTSSSPEADTRIKVHYWLSLSEKRKSENGLSIFPDHLSFKLPVAALRSSNIQVCGAVLYSYNIQENRGGCVQELIVRSVRLRQPETSEILIGKDNQLPQEYVGPGEISTSILVEEISSDSVHLVGEIINQDRYSNNYETIVGISKDGIIHPRLDLLAKNRMVWKPVNIDHETLEEFKVRAKRYFNYQAPTDYQETISKKSGPECELKKELELLITETRSKLDSASLGVFAEGQYKLTLKNADAEMENPSATKNSLLIVVDLLKKLNSIFLKMP